MTAHYFASRAVKRLIISTDLRPVGETIVVSGKAEARRIAAERGAKCWNF